MLKVRIFVKQLSKMFWPEDIVYIDYRDKIVTVRGCQHSDCDTCHDEYDWEQCEIMQSTGLKDEFEKELFEGDVILWTYWDEFEDSGRAKIIFDKGMFKLLDIRTGKDVWDNLFDCLENCDVYFQGNIYENQIFEEKR
jgi:uncharacterized phage protein (TIGR01671 family)